MAITKDWTDQELYKYLRYGFTDDYENSIQVSDQGMSLNANIQGIIGSTSQNYFYLFVPRCKGKVDEGYENSRIQNRETQTSLQISDPNSVFIVTMNKDHSNSWKWDSYIDTYKVTIPQNNTGQKIDTNLVCVIEWKYVYAGSKCISSSGSKTVLFSVHQSVSQNESAEASVDFYYRVDNSDTLTPTAPFNVYTPIKNLPVTISAPFDSEGNNINNYKYIYLKTADNKANQLTYNKDASWISFEQMDDNIRGVRIYKISALENTSDDFRSSDITILSNGTAVMKVAVSQYAANDGFDPSDETPENEYWNTGSEVKIIDRNEGAVIDASSLLYKSNQANIYSTIEQKDNTLFLGNYINNNTINNIPKVMQDAVGNDNLIKVFDSTRKVTLKKSNQSYSYIPDLTQSSQTKRLFKCGETYLLGLVFVNNTGSWSTVCYLGDDKGKWSPSVEPKLSVDESSFYYNKPIKRCALSKELTSQLSSMGIIGVIPVYAAKNSHNVKCQGYLAPTLTSKSRKDTETITAQYSWYYRSIPGQSDTHIPYVNEAPSSQIEIQNLDKVANEQWDINSEYCSINTPEVEIGETLNDSMLTGSLMRNIAVYNNSRFTNNVLIQTTGKYIHSLFSSANPTQTEGGLSVSRITTRYISGYLWKGFLHNKQDENALLSATNDTSNYKWFMVYPWQRDKIGGEGPISSITTKKILNVLYSDCTQNYIEAIDDADLAINDLAIYRDYDTNSLLRVGGGLYQGNIDYISVANNAYKAYAESGIQGSEYNYPRAAEGTYAGYNADGLIYDPVSIKYKTAPHIIAKLNSALYYTENEDNPGICVMELYDETDLAKSSVHDLLGYQWIKCGDIKRVIPNEETMVNFEEGDYFFGRFDSLRTYAYTNEDPNSVIEVVSGMLCSRINLDSRCDRNRGGNTPTISPVNFNLFNEVYNQSNNFFTFVYNDIEDVAYNREYKNSVQWSMTKNYSSDIDDWCNIQDSNTMDLDGDKGQLEALVRLGNNLIAFQDTGISQIQYNEKTQIATTEGVPIEIANSGKVDGKYYLQDNIGCQDKRTIAKSPSGVYFIDNINKSAYLLGTNGQLMDICTSLGMKSWALANIDDNWWSYYDTNSQEVLFTNEVESLAFNDVYKKFSAFLGYGNVRWNFRIGDKTAQITPPLFTQVISTTTRFLSSSERLIDKIKQHSNAINLFWKKNSIDATQFFGNYSPVEIQLHCNPEPTLDKIFSTVEYRADCFDRNGNYYPNISFDTFRAWNEYQDTLETAMYFTNENKNYAVYSRGNVYRLKKKFRIWRIDMPRAYYGSTIYVPGNTVEVPDVNQTVPTETTIKAVTVGITIMQ